MANERAGAREDGVGAARRRWRAVAARAAAALVLVVGLALLLLRVPAVATPLVNRLAAAFNPYPDTRLTVAQARGGFVTGLELRGVRLARTDGSDKLAVDTLRATYRLPALLLRRVSLGRVVVAGASVRLTQGSDSVWDWAAPFRADTVAAPPAEGPSWQVRVGALRVSRARIEAVPAAPAMAPLRVEDLEVRLSGVRLPAALAFALDTLGARVFVPALPDTAAHIALAAAFADDVLRVSLLRLRSSASDVDGSGTVVLPGADPARLRDVDFALRADPLDFRDIAPFVPALSSAPSLALDARASGGAELLGVRLDARLDDGASLLLDAGFTLSDSPVHWRADATLRGLDPRHLLRDAGPAGPFDADLALDLRGASRDRLDGRVEVRTGAAVVAGFALLPAELVAVFADGLARLDGRLAADGVGHLDIAGTVRPFDAAPLASLRLRARQAPGEALDAGVPVSGLDATLALDAELPAADSLRAAVSLDVRSARVADSPIDRASVRANWSADAGDLLASATLAGGALAVQADVRRSADVWDVDLRSARATGIDLAQLTDDAAAGTLEVRVRGRVRGADAASLRGDIELDASGTRYADVALERGRVATTLRDGGVTARLDVAAGAAGSIGADIAVRPFDEEPSWAAMDVRVVALDLAPFGGPASRLHARASLRGAGFDPAGMRATGVFAIDSSRIGDVVIDGLDTTLALADAGLRLDVDARLLRGDVALRLEARPFEVEPTFALEADPIRTLDLGELGTGVRTSLSGRIRIDGAGRDAASLRLAADARLAGGVGRGRLDDAVVAIRAADGRADVDARATTTGGRARLRADAAWRTVPAVIAGVPAAGSSVTDAGADSGVPLERWSLDLDAQLPDLDALADLPAGRVASLDASIAARGSGSTRETLAFDVDARVAGRFDGLYLEDGRIRAAGGAGTARVDTLRLESPAFIARGAGTFLYAQPARPDARADARLDIELRDAAPFATLVPLAPLAAREAALALRLTGPWTAQAFDASLRLENAAVGPTAIASATLEVDGVLAAGEPGAVEAGLRMRDVITRDIGVDSLAAAASYRHGERLPIDVRLDIRGGRSLDFAATLEPDALDAGLRVDRTELRMGRDAWTLPAPARIAWVDGITVEELYLVSRGRRLGATGRIDPRGEQDFRIDIDSLEVGAISDLAGVPDLDGRLTGGLHLRGPADAVRIDGRFEGVLGDRDGATARLAADVRGDGRDLVIDVGVTDDDDRRLTVSGSMPLRLSIDPDHTVDDPLGAGTFALDARADSVSTGWLRPFVRPFGVDRLTGALVVDAGLTGTAAAPVLRGAARLVGGELDLPDLGIRYRDVTAVTALDGRGIRLEAEARSRGTARVRGDIALDELRLGRLQLDASFDRFHALTNELTRFTLSGDVTVTGTTDAPVIGGTVRVVDTDFLLDAAGQGVAPPVELTPADLRMLRDYFGLVPGEAARVERDPLEPVALDLRVQIGESVWARRRLDPQMTLLLAGSLDVRKAAGDSIQLFGTLETVPERSFFRQFQRRFQVVSGAVTFNGYIPTWRVDMQAQYAVPARDADASQVDITLAVRGGPDDLELTLGSAPEMEAPDVISYLATGRPAASAVAFGEGGGIGETGAALAIGTAAGLLETFGADQIGLDVVEVRQEGARGATIVGGRFLSSRVYVGFQQPIVLRQDLDAGATRQEVTRVEFEYALYRWLLANVQGGAGSLSVVLRARRAY